MTTKSISKGMLNLQMKSATIIAYNILQIPCFLLKLKKKFVVTKMISQVARSIEIVPRGGPPL